MPYRHKKDYISVMMDNAAKAREHGDSFEEATAINAMVKAAWNEMTLEKLIDVLERKGVLSEGDRAGLNQEVFYAMQQISKAAEAKYSSIADVAKRKKPR